MSRRPPRTVYIERESGSSFVWFLLGGALGAGLALWFAPQSGDRTRRVVGRKLSKLRDRAEEAFDDLKDALSPSPERSAEPEEEEESAAPESDGDEPSPRAAEPSLPRRNSRQELEQRLAEARARRRRALADEDEEPVA